MKKIRWIEPRFKNERAAGVYRGSKNEKGHEDYDEDGVRIIVHIDHPDKGLPDLQLVSVFANINYTMGEPFRSISTQHHVSLDTDAESLSLKYAREIESVFITMGWIPSDEPADLTGEILDHSHLGEEDGEPIDASWAEE